MKLSILIPCLFLLVTCNTAFGETYPVTVYGALVDGKGNGVPDKTIYISNTKNSKFILIEKTSTYAAGEFKWQVHIPDSIKEGALLISYINCDNKEVITEGHFSMEKNIIQVKLIYCDKIISTVCSSAITVKKLNDSVSLAIVNNKGISPFKHKWSTGQDGDSIRFKSKSEYKICVVSVDAGGCISEACIHNDPICSAEIHTNKLNDSMAIAIVIAKGKAPFRYKWTNGSDNDTIRFNPKKSEGFCVKVVDSVGCSTYTCIENPYTCASAVLVTRLNDSVAIAYVIARGHNGKFVHTWTTGEKGDSIRFNPLNKIKICVRSVDTSGCVTEACVTFIPEVCKAVIERAGNVLYAYLRSDIAKEYKWSTGATSPTIEVKEPGEYCVAIHGAGGCDAKVCYTVKEIDTTECKAEIVVTRFPLSSTADVVPGYKLSIAAKFPLKIIKWSTGDTTESIIVRKNGEYCVTISDNVKCKFYLCKKIIVDTVKCTMKIQIDTLPSSSNTTKKLKLTAIPTFESKLFYWSTNEATKSITVDHSGKYCVTASDGVSCKVQECVTIDLPSSPPNTECTASLVIHPISANEVKLVPRVSGSVPFTFLWTTGSKDATINVKTSGNYCVSIKDGSGCIAKACAEIAFENPGSAVLPPLADPKNTGLTPNTNKSNIELKVYPNPSQDKVIYNVKTKQDLDGMLTVSNMYGKLVYQERIKFKGGISNGDLDLSFLGSGIYQVTIDQNGYMTTSKIVIAK